MTNERTGVILLTQQEIPPGLVQAVKRQGGYEVVETAFWKQQNPEAGLQKSVENVISMDVGRIYLIPAQPAGFDSQVTERIEQLLAGLEMSYPDTEFNLVSPDLDIEHRAHILVESLHKAENGRGGAQTMPLSALQPKVITTIDRLIGSGDFISRLAALGFIPGSPVQVVQNFGVGPIIVSVRGGQLALGREEANKIRVKKIGVHSHHLSHHHGRGRRLFKGGRRF